MTSHTTVIHAPSLATSVGARDYNRIVPAYKPKRVIKKAHYTRLSPNRIKKS
jgi:hypothetical protein